MEETVVRPSVFVVDGQTDIPFTRLGRSRRRQPCSAARLGLGLLLLLLATGVLSPHGRTCAAVLHPCTHTAMCSPVYSPCVDVMCLFLRLRVRRPTWLRKPCNPRTCIHDRGAGPRDLLVQDRRSQQANPAAHLTGANSSLTGSGGPLLWETKLGLAFLRGLTYRDGALVIAQAGYYYIYSKVQLGGVGCPQGLTGGLPITHGLYKRTARYPEELELLVSRRSPCGRASSPQVWWDSSFLGGVVHLDAGEEVVVRVPDESLVRVRDGTRSYFGAFMV
ncbi:hypothetical protein E2I00_011289 [Balaenoptera physalus]|uniref:THD domain-containing protein n=1 Tax=Balaenoptera physalus TaxID=9770 RepID=A0A643BWP3_BALPH|nr:hypothetical protein E2I00_011289 [Balaenoptera physalus]